MNTLLFMAAPFLLSADPMGPLQAREAVIDLGAVKAGMPVTRTFSLTNRGSGGVSITGLNAGCGCMRPRVDRKRLQPGESAELAVEINTLAQNSGPNAWKVTVRYEDERTSQAVPAELELQVKAKIVREINVEPVSLSLSIERETSHSITVTDRRTRPLTIRSAQCESKHVKLQAGAVGQNSLGQRTQQVQVTVLESCPTGRFAEELILLTDDPEYRELRVPLMVTRRVAGLATAVPEQVHLRLARGQKTASELIRIRTADDRRVAVEKIETDNPAVRFKWADGPGTMVTLRLGVDFDQTPVSGLATMKVFLSAPKPDVIEIPISWDVP